MKNFLDYLKESEQAAREPVVGDTFAINIREECLIESVVVESRRDGVVIAADERMMQLLESYGYTFEQTCMECGMMECGCGQDPEQYSDETDAGQDPGEYDYEGDMAKDELYTMIRSARRLIGMLDNDDNMPEWTQKKINKATDYVDTAADYISSKKERGVMEQSEDLNLQDLIKKHRELVRSYNYELRMNDNTHFPYMDEIRDRLKEMWKLIQAKKAADQQSVTEQSEEFSPVARATLHRIMMRHPGMLAQHGPEKVMAAVDDVADLVGDMDDIGTSDISGWVNMVQEILDSQDQNVAEDSGQSLSVQQLATISDAALDQAYGYGRSTPGNSFGWQANLMSAAYAKKLIDAGVTDIEKISDAIHKGWNVTAQKFVQNPEQFDDTEKLRQAGKLDAKLQQRAKLMKINYAQLDNEEQEKDRVVARALLQAIKGQQGVAEGSLHEDLQADDGERYRSADDFFGQFEADHFDEEQVSDDGMEIRGYIDGVNVMVWRFNSPRKTSGYGKYDDSGLGEAGVAEGSLKEAAVDREGPADLLAAVEEEMNNPGRHIDNLTDVLNATFGSNRSPEFNHARKVIAQYLEFVTNADVDHPSDDPDDDEPMISAMTHGDIARHIQEYDLTDYLQHAAAELEEVVGMNEAEYQGRKVPLGKPMRGDVKKSKVYVKNPQGNVVKVNFGDPNMKIKKSNPDRRKSFRARHNCDNPGPRHKARYWSCRAW